MFEEESEGSLNVAETRQVRITLNDNAGSGPARVQVLYMKAELVSGEIVTTWEQVYLNEAPRPAPSFTYPSGRGHG